MFHQQDQAKNFIEAHIKKINKVIGLMQLELVRKNGHCGGQINFGKYTSPIPPFEDGYNWLENRYKPQPFKTVSCILNLGITTHWRRLEILNRIKNDEYIYAEEHALLMMVKALQKDPLIADYKNIYITNNFKKTL